jgi:gamma-glutamylcyclotransferase (GGCT)/AIG2-like uncharacterized protein YtfP|tara:strand:+ start:6019 stop:6627 length:609 start_codon:yes stop_codon:yes gene_type:complete
MQTFKIHPNSAFTPLHNGIKLMSYSSDDMLNTTKHPIDTGYYLFSYGSNSLNQLKKRVKNNKLTGEKAYINGYTRIFAGKSNKWNGGVASIVKSNIDDTVKGSLVYLSDNELKRLDIFEGANKNENPFSKIDNFYRREYITVFDSENNKINCIVYIKNNHNWVMYPSNEYLEAVKKNIIEYWGELNELYIYDHNLYLRGKYS